MILRRGGGAVAPCRAARGLGRGSCDALGRRSALVEASGPRPTTRPSALAHVATARVALHEARPARRPRGAGTCPPPASAARPRHPVADGPRRPRAHPRPSRARASPRPPARCSPRPSGCSNCGPTWAPSRTTRASCATRSTATTAPGGTWAMSLTGAELRLLPVSGHASDVPRDRLRGSSSRVTRSKTEAVFDLPQARRPPRAARRSRSAVEIGLLDSSIYPPRADLIHEG